MAPAVLLMMLGPLATVVAQAPTTGDSVLAATLLRPHRAVRPWHAAAALGSVAVLSILDPPFHRATQNARSSATDDVAAVFRHVGQPEVYATVGLGTIAVGLIAGDDRVAMSGVRISSSVLVAGVSTQVIKRLTGRWRPYQTDHAWKFSPFKARYDAFPSGHTSVAFALAASVSDELHRTWATAGLYTIATGTAWSRMNDEKHWFSDVVAGALVGVASAKFVNGRWRVFGISAPHFMLGPGGAGVDMSFSMPAIR